MKRVIKINGKVNDSFKYKFYIDTSDFDKYLYQRAAAPTRYDSYSLRYKYYD